MARRATLRLTVAAELRRESRVAVQALPETVHAHDPWIAASAVHIGAPVLTVDGVSDHAPGLTPEQ